MSKKADENRIQFQDAVRRLKAQLDRTPPRSSSRKALEKAYQKLISRGPSAPEESNEEDDQSLV